MSIKIAIVGAGAAGCFAAANLPIGNQIEISVFEKTGKALQKVKASGGGRCNVTHACFDVPDLLTRYPRGKALLKKTLYRFGCQHTIQWFTEKGIALKTEDDGRVFPISNDSQTIIDCIWSQMALRNLKVYYHKAVAAITKANGGLVLQFADGSIWQGDAVLIAVGGFPKREQYQWLLDTGHTIQSPVPSLFTFNTPRNPITELMGVSIPNATVKIGGTKLLQQGPVLVTHWGFSGPAVLKTSAFAARELAERNYDFNAVFNWLGDADDSTVKETFALMRATAGGQLLFNKSPFPLPRRFWEYQLKRAGVSDTMRWGELTASAQNKLIESLLRDTYPVSGKTTFKEEFVTCGGLTLSEINPQTLESKLMPNVYFAGELLDVDGITGGYNFQNAWSSAWIAAERIAATVG
jgi:predicted Rossmann fold flavoprotein